MSSPGFQVGFSSWAKSIRSKFLEFWFKKESKAVPGFSGKDYYNSFVKLGMGSGPPGVAQVFAITRQDN